MMNSKSNKVKLRLPSQMNIERFIIKIMIIAGVVASSITTLIQVISLQKMEISVVIGLIAIASMSFCYLLTRFNKVILAGILTTSILLILMSMEVIFAQFLRQTSIATLIVLAFSNSVAYQNKTRLILHVVTFLTLTCWVFFLNTNHFELPDGSSFVAMGINLLGTYALMAFIAYILKRKYDNAIVELNQTVAELKDTESHLVHSEKMAALGTLSAGVGHELNNPLNYIKNGLQLLNDKLELHVNTRTDVKPFLEIIEEGVKRAAAIVKSLYEFSHSTPVKHHPVSTKRILENCLTLTQHELTENIKVEVEIENEHTLIMGDQGALHQVYINVLVNAIQSIENKGVIRIKQSIDSKQEVIMISDSGTGISEENLHKVMEPFFTTKDPGKGTGLGLSVSYAIIKKHKGLISFKSELGNGTEVTIKFPCIEEK